MVHFSRGEHLGELPKGLRSARPILVIDDIRVMPFLQLQDLRHFWQDTDSPLLWRCEHLFPCDISQKTAQFEYLHTRSMFEFDAMSRIRCQRWQSYGMIAHHDFACVVGYELLVLCVLPRPRVYREDGTELVVRILGEIAFVC